MAVNRYCVVMIQGTKMNPHTRRSEPAFMLDPHVTFPNPDVDPRALDMVRERAAVVRARLRGTDPDDEVYRLRVREQAGVQLVVKPVILEEVPEAAEDQRV